MTSPHTALPSSDIKADNDPKLAVAATGAKNVVPELLVQQRQILAMMGLDIWVQRNRLSHKVDYQVLVEQQDKRLKEGPKLSSKQAEVKKDNYASDNAKSIKVNAELINDGHQNTLSQKEGAGDLDKTRTPTRTQLEAKEKPSTHDPIQTLKQKLIVCEAQIAEDKASIANSLEQVAPFEIVGFYFKGWVLIADAQLLQDEQQLALWENIANALSSTPQVLKFPICTGISDKEAASASVAGFIFFLAKTHEVKVAALTPLPQGIDYPKLRDMPHLLQMLEDSDLKRQLWQTLSND